MCEGLKCGKAGRKPWSVPVARIGNGKHSDVIVLCSERLGS